MLEKRAYIAGIGDDGNPNVFAINPRNADLEKTASALKHDKLHPSLSKFIRELKPEKGNLYVLVNALGSGEYYGSNINADWFGDAVLRNPDPANGYKTFLKAYVTRHHQNKSPDTSFGKVLAAEWNPKMHRVELIMAVDRGRACNQGHSDLVDSLDRGENPAVSMGMRTRFDVCSICNHKSYTLRDRCQHISSQKNQILPDGRIVCMINPEFRAFDISFVLVGADRTSFAIAKLASAEGHKPIPHSYYQQAAEQVLEKVARVRPKVKIFRAFRQHKGAAALGNLWGRTPGAKSKIRKLQGFLPNYDRVTMSANKLMKLDQSKRKLIGEADTTVKALQKARAATKAVKKKPEVDLEAVRRLLLSKRTGVKRVLGDPTEAEVLRKAEKLAKIRSRTKASVLRKQKGGRLSLVEGAGNLSLSKTAGTKHVIVTGHSGAGKSTEGDAHWHNTKAKASSAKIAELIKRVPLTEELSDREDSFPKETLNRIGKTHTPEDLVRSSAATGVILKPHEFQRTILIRIGRPDMADRYDAARHTFCPCSMSRLPRPSISLGGALNPHFRSTFLPAMDMRSMFKPIINRRIILIKQLQPKEKRASVSDPVLDKIAAAYAQYRADVISTIVPTIESVTLQSPDILARIYPDEVEECFGGKMKRAGRETAATQGHPLLGLIPVAYLLGKLFSKKKIGEDEEKKGFVRSVISQHPLIATSFAVGLLGMATKRTV